MNVSSNSEDQFIVSTINDLVSCSFNESYVLPSHMMKWYMVRRV